MNSSKKNLRPVVAAVTSAMTGMVMMIGVAAPLFVPLNATAQNIYSTAQAEVDAPARVGRVAFVSGGVQSYSEADPQWRAARINEPVTSRNSFFTDANGRTEMRIGPTTLALDASSQIDIAQLDDAVFSSTLTRGSLSVRLNQMDNDDHVIVNTPNGQFTLEKVGRYRIDAGPGASTVTVFAGRAQTLTGSGMVRVDAGKSLRISTSGGGESFMFGPATSTEFDGWTLARDERYREGPSVKYVSPNMTGYEDLDANGQWASDPDYGTVWYPTTFITAGWAPYRYGRWTWVAPWGWTWVDDAPWGFAPFHYGRWVSIGGRWGWTPGAYVARPAFAPALVGFYGGSGFSLSVSVGGGPALGWYPLAPWERYTPGYTRNTTYINRVNNITIVNPPPRYAGRDDLNRINGATVIRQADFGNRKPVAALAVRNLPEDFIRHAPVVAPSAVLPQRPQPARPQAAFTSTQPGRPDFNRGPDVNANARSQPNMPNWQRQDEGNARLNAPRIEERRVDGRQNDRYDDMQRERQLDQMRAQQGEQQRQQQQFERQRNDQLRAEQQRAEFQRGQEQRDQQLRDQQRDQQRQQREFERRVTPVHMEPMPQMQQPDKQMPRPKPEQPRVEQPRVEQPRMEQPRVLNVEQPPAQVPSRFNQVPQEQRGDNQGQRGGSRFRPPDQQ